EEGTVVQEGPTIIWYSGREDPVPMLREEVSAAHRRFESLLGETDIAEPPLRILGFHEHTALVKFYTTCFHGIDLAAQLGLYLQRPWNILTLCTSEVPGRLDDPRSLAGSLYDVILLEQVYGTLPSPWIQSGLVKALGAWGHPGDLVRLNRRMAASLSGGTA